jgi:hypothetical protein
VASGLIAGGALAGVLQGITDLLQEGTGWELFSFQNDGWGGNWLGIFVFIALGICVYLDAKRAKVENGNLPEQVD